jgi:hypothetical protein
MGLIGHSPSMRYRRSGALTPTLRGRIITER